MLLTDTDMDMASDYLQRSRQISGQAYEEQVRQKRVAGEELENAYGAEGVQENPPALLASKMGVGPGPEDVLNGFAHPKFGPPRGNFCEVGDFQNFFVISADGPDIFYVQDILKKGALLDLERAMTEFYDEHWANEPRMKEEDIVLGGFYVSYSDKFQTWNRCRVEGLVKNTDSETEKSEQELLVQLLDYGTWDIVTLKEIYPFRPEFLDLPTQVCAASLFDNNEPTAVKWTAEEKKEFIRKVGGKVIPGYVMGVKDSAAETFPRLQLLLLNQDEDGKDGSLMLGDRLNLAIDTEDSGAEAQE